MQHFSRYVLMKKIIQKIQISSKSWMAGFWVHFHIKKIFLVWPKMADFAINCYRTFRVYSERTSIALWATQLVFVMKAEALLWVPLRIVMLMYVRTSGNAGMLSLSVAASSSGGRWSQHRRQAGWGIETTRCRNRLASRRDPNIVRSEIKE